LNGLERGKLLTLDRGFHSARRKPLNCTAFCQDRESQ